MKQLVLLLVCTFYAIPGITQLLYYSENIEIQNIPPEQALQKTKKWAAINFSNFREALQYEDNNTLILEGTVRSALPSPVGTFVAQTHYHTYKVIISVEVNNIRIELKDFAKKNGSESFPTLDRETSLKNMEEIRVGKKMKQSLIDDINHEYDNLDQTAEWIFQGIVDELNRQ